MMKMKNPTIWTVVLFFAVGFCQLVAQEKSPVTTTVATEKDEGPIIFKFEPEYTSAEETKRQEFKRNRALVNALEISDRKRRRLMKKVFSKDFSKYLSEIVTVDTKLEDEQ